MEKGRKFKIMANVFKGKYPNKLQNTDIFSRQNSFDILSLLYAKNVIAFDSLIYQA